MEMCEDCISLYETHEEENVYILLREVATAIMEQAYFGSNLTQNFKHFYACREFGSVDCRL